MCFIYVIEKIIVCLCSFDFLVRSDKVCQFWYFLPVFNRTDGFIAMLRKRNVSIPVFKPILDFCEANGSVLETFLFLNSLLADDIRPSRKDVKVTAVCQSLTNLLRDTTYRLRVGASFLRSAPVPAGPYPGAGRDHSGAGLRLAWITGSAWRSVRWRSGLLVFVRCT